MGGSTIVIVLKVLFSDVSDSPLEDIFRILRHGTVVTDKHRISCIKNRFSLKMASRDGAETSENNLSLIHI